LWTGAVTSETPQSSAWYDTSTNRISNGGSWTYDTAGNIKTVGGMSRSFTYDPEERQTQAVVNGTTENYVYDGEGRRVAKSTSAGTTTYIYDADGQLAMEFPSGSVPTGTSYLTADVLGSTRLVTGTTTECEDYLPFGEQIQSGTDGRSDGCFSAADVVPEKKFTSKERDVNTGLDFFGARYFSSAQGRFTSPDAPFADQHPEDPQSWNMYAYVRNNPLKNTDPDGRDCFTSVSSCGSFLLGGLKRGVTAVTNDVVNAPARLTNLIISPFTDYRFPDPAPNLLQPTNADERQGAESVTAVIMYSPLAEAGAAAVDAIGTGARAGEAATATDVPTSIPAGPSARPTAAQQRAINEMGEAHGCNTCGTTSPGTTTGNWVGDHQPPTALNPSGGAQVYQPQCLQCSRQQGGQVAAAARAAKKAACTTGSDGTTCQ
jgi:RHS repeat-associated protein